MTGMSGEHGIPELADPALNGVRVSVVIPSYLREETLVGTVQAAVSQCVLGDEVIIVDQTPQHEPATARTLAELEERGAIRWIRKTTPSICEAMNVGAILAKGSLLVFLDDDAMPAPGFLETYRRVFGGADAPLSACGQVLQPWDEGPSEVSGDTELGFNFACRRPAEIVGIIAMNFAVRRDVFLAIGGMDETFSGGAHRCDAEVGYRLVARTGRTTRFVPEASVRHLHAQGGTRAHGHKDSWAAIESAIGDHYFGLRCLPVGHAILHSGRRMIRAPFNRNTARRPWLIVSIAVRETVAWMAAVKRRWSGPGRFLRPISEYPDVVPGTPS